MKRALLIAGGTVGGLGAVLSITPPQLGSQGAMGGLSTLATAAATTAAPVAQATTTQTTTTPVATTPVVTTATTAAATPKAVTKKKKRVVKKRKVAVAKTTTQSNSSATAPATTAANTPAPAKSTAPAAAPAPAPKKVSGTFTGSVVNVNFGNVQVQITVVDGKITDAQALQAPSGGRSGSISSQAIPMLRQQTLTAQSSAIQGVGGASYTSYGWYTSLQSALSKAGLPL